jgi:hypothetical protein
VAGWHVGDPVSIIGRGGLYTFECIIYSQRREHSWDGYVRYTKVLISFYFTLLSSVIEHALERVPKTLTKY